jgi:uncharacterized membrane protein YccC
MKERTIVGCIVGALVLLGVTVVTKSTDVIFVVASIAFFILCIAYAAWCERL